jgi:YaiO family outer membrane protein
MLPTLTLLVFVGVAAQQSSSPPAWPQAERLARGGQAREALEQFQRIVAEQPNDVEARIWIGRLWRRIGRPHLAEKEFREALRLAPEHVDALVALASALTSRGAASEASELIDRAERLAPNSSEVLAARARALRLSGRSAESEAYYGRAWALDPHDGDIKQGLDQARRVNRHRIEASFQHEALSSSASGAGLADVAVDLRGSDRLRLNARVQVQSRFSREEARAGAGLEWRLRPNLTLRGSTMVSPGAELIARTDTTGEVEHVRGHVDFGAGVRWVSFATARVGILAPAATIWLNDRTALGVRYYASWTSFSERRAALNHSALTRIRYSVRPRLWLDAAYSRGYESIDTLSLDRLGSFRADTLSGGVLYHLGGLQSLATGVDYQWRSDDRTMVRITAAVVHRF